LLIAEGPIYLRDIATVTDAPESDAKFHYVTSDKSMMALILGIKKQSGGNTVSISNGVHQALPEIKLEQPTDMDLNVWFDEAIWIKESILDVEWS
jgi:multidrug efflux pump subunit AcrB